jgi:FAD/FMN-containing dehydrogenase
MADDVANVLSDLIGSFGGQLITPESDAYEEARHIWNGMVDKRPGLIATCTSRDDVVAVVRSARRHGATVSVLGGGHGVSGKALADGGVTIDLGGMTSVIVDPERKLVHVDGGCRLGHVDEATSAHAMVVPAGIVSDTGVAGLVLGGGIGWMSRKHGLSCDNFASLELVMADGEVLEVNEETHPELLWALKGGGGNFGVVTRFTFKAYDFGPDMRLGISVYRPEDAKEALLEYARVYPSLPNVVGWHGALKRYMPDRPFVPRDLVGEQAMMLFCMWLGELDDPEGAEWMERLASVGSPADSHVVERPFGMGVQRMLDEEFPRGRRYYTKEGHLEQFSEEAIDALLDFWNNSMCAEGSSMDGEVEIIGLGGAIKDVPEEAAAFANRRSDWWINYATHWGDAELDGPYVDLVRASYESLRPWIGQGVYVNMLNFDELDRVVEAYGGPAKYERLGEVKAKYDPDNFFRMNHNIAPARSPDLAGAAGS